MRRESPPLHTCHSLHSCAFVSETLSPWSSIRDADRERETRMLLRFLRAVNQKTHLRSNKSRSPRRLARQQMTLEILEDRSVPSAVSWINPNGGDWDTASNWSTGFVPGAADDVTINQAGSVTITHNNNSTDRIKSLTNSNIINLSAGVIDVPTFQNTGMVILGPSSMLAVDNYIQTAGTTLLQGGTLGSYMPPVNTALSFNGGDNAAAPSTASLNPNSQMTIEAWVNVNALSGTPQGIAGTWDDLNANARTNFLWIQGDQFAFYVSHTGFDFPAVLSTTAVQTNQWYHVAGVFDGSTMFLYVNGVLEGEASSPGPIATNSQPFTIGSVA